MGNPLKILLLEDSPLDAELIQRLLLKEVGHCEFKLATSKKTYLNALKEFTPDVILSDNSLPGFNAAEALKIARQLSIQIPFILITGTVSEEYAAGIIKEGADDYILKDRMTRLPVSIDSALRQRNSDKEKREAAEKLKASEQKYRTLVEQAFDGILVYSSDGVILDCNDTAGNYMGYTKTELRSLTIQQLFFEEDLKKNPLYFKTLKKGYPTFDYRKLKRKDGSCLEMEISTKMMPDGNMIATARDITERKKAEQQKEFDHNNLSALINNTKDLMWSVDRDLKLITFNDSFNEAITLMSGKALIKGRDILSTQFTEDQRERYEVLYNRALAGETFTIIDHFVASIEIWTEISFYPIRHEGQVIGTACFSRDITERLKAEKELRRMEQDKLESKIEEQKRITRAMLIAQEKERNAIGIELHDNVNQILVGTNLILSMTRSSPDNIQELITSSMNHLQEAIQENRKIAHVFVPPDFEQETLVTQLKKLIDNMLTASNIDIQFSTQQFNEDLLDNERKLNIYRIAQEQCTNIVKYAKIATAVNIVLASTGNSFKMTIKDNGAGMDADKKTTGIGLRNINSRLALFNGVARITTAPGKGFELDIEIPL
jgi:PAS domain S-box-containing protein